MPPYLSLSYLMKKENHYVFLSVIVVLKFNKIFRSFLPFIILKLIKKSHFSPEALTGRVKVLNMWAKAFDLSSRLHE